MTGAVIARRYARALLSLAESEQALEEVGAGLDDLADLLAENDKLVELFERPEVPPEDKVRMASEVAGQARVLPLVREFVRYLAHKRRFTLLPAIREVYHELADERLGRAQAEVTVAAPLAEAEVARLQELYSRLSGKQVTVSVSVDPDILGGAITRIGSTVWDGSLRSALKSIQTEIAQG